MMVHKTALQTLDSTCSAPDACRQHTLGSWGTSWCCTPPISTTCTNLGSLARPSGLLDLAPSTSSPQTTLSSPLAGGGVQVLPLPHLIRLSQLLASLNDCLHHSDCSECAISCCQTPICTDMLSGERSLSTQSCSAAVIAFVPLILCRFGFDSPRRLLILTSHNLRATLHETCRTACKVEDSWRHQDQLILSAGLAQLQVQKYHQIPS